MERPSEFQDLPAHITYIPQGKGSGLQVRLWADGEEISRFFALSHYKSPKDCLKAALIWRDVKQQFLPETNRSHSQRSRERISEARTRTGIRGFGFSVTRKGSRYSLVAHVQWTDREGETHKRQRSLYKHGIRGACNQLSRVLTEIPTHADREPEVLADWCSEALWRVFFSIYHAGEYNTLADNEEERYQVIADFVEENASEVL